LELEWNFMYWFSCVRKRMLESYIVIWCCACWISVRFQCVPIGLKCSMLWYTKWYAPMISLLTHLFTWSSHGSTSYIESLDPLKIFGVFTYNCISIDMCRMKRLHKGGEISIYEIPNLLISNPLVSIIFTSNHWRPEPQTIP